MSEFVKTVNIEGMQCNHCKMTVEKVLKELNGVNQVNVNLEDKKAVIKSQKEIDDNKIRDVIVGAGFEVKEIN